MRIIEHDHKFPIEHQPDELLSNVSVFFPGQDVRRPGMFEEPMAQPAGKEVIERGSKLLYDMFGYDILKIAAPDADPLVFRQTEPTQTAVFLYAIALNNNYKYHDQKEGFATLPRYVSGNSMGMVIAATMSGALSFEQGLWLIGMRGKLMQEEGDPMRTAMAAVIGANKDVIKNVLRKHRKVDLCLINSESVYIIGGPDNGNDNDPLPIARREFEFMGFKTVPVDTDRSMHGRYVRPAKKAFKKALHQIDFKDPIIPLVGTYRVSPITTAKGIIEELEWGFDHTFNNAAILRFLNEAEEIYVASEVNDKGTFTKIMERSFQAIPTRKLGLAALAALGVTAVAWGLHEAVTRHHPDRDKIEKAEKS